MKKKKPDTALDFCEGTGAFEIAYPNVICPKCGFKYPRIQLRAKHKRRYLKGSKP